MATATTEENSELRAAINKYLTRQSKEDQEKNAASHGVQLRFRPPYRFTCLHDARGDAVTIAIENMMEKRVPLWALHILSQKFVDDYCNELQTKKCDFVHDLFDSIEADTWCRLVNRRFEEFALKYARNELPLPEKPVEWDQVLYSLSTDKNRKPKMEDRNICLPSLCVLDANLEDMYKKDQFYAVFDGHNGAECAAYCASHFHEVLLQVLKQPHDKENFIRDVFLLMDDKLTLRCLKANYRSGTTACCVYISDNTAYLGWCGDSSIGMFKKDKIVTLSSPHYPDLPDEEERIKNLGGVVTYLYGVGRVNGVLNISRSLGDLSGRPMISQTPDLLTYKFSDDDLILFLASDGVWETLKEYLIYQYAIEFAYKNPVSDYQLMANYIVKQAKKNTIDNLTLICVFLKDINLVWSKLKTFAMSSIINFDQCNNNNFVLDENSNPTEMKETE